jgi:signal peptidase I
MPRSIAAVACSALKASPGIRRADKADPAANPRKPFAISSMYHPQKFVFAPQPVVPGQCMRVRWVCQVIRKGRGALCKVDQIKRIRIAHLNRALTLILGMCLTFSELRRRFEIIQVTGRSMNPTLCDGDWLVGRRLHSGSVDRHDIVLLEGFGPNPLLKRVVAIAGDALADVPPASAAGSDSFSRHATAVSELGPGTIFVLGDNASASADSRAFGPVSVTSVSTVALAVVWPP